MVDHSRRFPRIQCTKMSNVFPQENGETRQPPLPCVEASKLVLRATDRAFHDIRRLAHVLGGVNLDSRREDLLDYIRLNRGRFIKAYATISWLSGGHGELIANAGNALAESRFQREQIDTCQDQMFFMHGALFRARQRMYDVPVAADVLVGGRYARLPKSIQYCGGDVDPRPTFELPANRKEILPRVDRAIRLALLRRGGVPSQFTKHVVSNGILTLLVEGEFQVRVTLLEERKDALWTLVGVDMKVHAREGETITAPTANARQKRYLYEVVQKAMDKAMGSKDATDGRSHDHELGPNPLLAAYQVCHDLCSSMVLEILHGQAQKLSARIGGFWATHLVVVFHKEAQVLDLCFWHREFSTGLAGTGREVGIGGVRALNGEGSLLHDPSEVELAANLPPPPAGCRYIRVHRPVDRQRQEMVASLGPAAELQKNEKLGSGKGNDSGNGQELGVAEGVEGGIGREKADLDDVSVNGGTVHVRADKLSCARVLLAATRTFASQKMDGLARDVKSLARQLGISKKFVGVTILGGLTARISSSNQNGALDVWLEVSVDARSGRYLVKDSGFATRKLGTVDFISRLEEALNLLPGSDSQSLGEKVTMALSAGGREPNVKNGSIHGGQQQDLRQQQVRRCMAECFGVLRRAEIEDILRRGLGLVPHQRWQALLGRRNAERRNVMPAIGWNAESVFRNATYSLIQQFREYEGCRGCRECRGFRILGYLERKGGPGREGNEVGLMSMSTLTLPEAKRVATTASPPGEVTEPSRGAVGPPLSTSSVVPDLHHVGPGVLPTVAATMVEDSNRGEGSNSQPPRAFPTCSLRACQLGRETSEVLSFFLEIGITENLELEHTLLVAGLLTTATGPGRYSLRRAVKETYTLDVKVNPGTGRGSYLPTGTPTTDSQQFALLGKRSASYMESGQVERSAGLITDEAIPTLSPGKGVSQSVASATQLQELQEPDYINRWLLDDVTNVTNMSKVELVSHEGTEAELHKVVRMAKRFIPFARLQHVVLRLSVGTALSLDIQGLARSLESPVGPLSCAVDLFLGGKEGWSSPEVAAESASVKFSGGHVEAEYWEWDVTLGPGTMLMDYSGPDHGVGEAARLHRARIALELVKKKLPLIEHTFVGALKAPGDAVGMEHCGKSLGKHIKFRFPPLFSIRAMCRSFALSGEGLAAMRTLAAQAIELQRSKGCDSGGGGGYSVLSCSPIHVAMHDPLSDHVVVLTHSAFLVEHISSQERAGLVLMPLPDDVPTCPAAIQELQAAVSKHGDLRGLLHGLSRTIPVLMAVSRVVPGVASVAGAPGSFGFGRSCSSAEGEFVLEPVSPACFVLSARPKTEMRPPLTLMIEASGLVRVTGLVDRKEDVVVNTAVLQDLLLEWIATGST